MTAVATAWDTLHQQARHRLEYPSEHVVRFLAGLDFGCDGGPKPKALDIGCGSGRHAILMDAFGFDTFACDASPDAVRATRTRWDPSRRRVKQAAMTLLPYSDEQFDVALAYAVFYYGTRAEHELAVAEMWRVLKPGGSGLIVTRSDRDWRKLHTGKDGVFRCAGQPEYGMRMTFQAEADIPLAYFDLFSDVRWERSETTTAGRVQVNSDLLIQVTR